MESSGTLDALFFNYCFAEDVTPCELHHFCLYIFCFCMLHAWLGMSVMRLQFCSFLYVSFIVFVLCHACSTGDFEELFFPLKDCMC